MKVYLAVSGLVIDDPQAISDYIDGNITIFSNRDKACQNVVESFIHWFEESDPKQSDIDRVNRILASRDSFEQKLMRLKLFITKYADGMIYDIYEKNLE